MHANGLARPRDHGGRSIALTPESDSIGFEPYSQEWEALMTAVRTRLSLTAEELSAQSSGDLSGSASARFSANLLECVSALEQIQTSMNREMDRSQELEAEVAETRGALARARDDLLGVRAGERRERHRATHDGLTLLPNRTFFLSSLRKAVAAAPHSGRGPGIFYLDLDDFKSINDTHGHALGDQLLRVVAARLLQAVRMEDVVCRLGGDEFACLLGGPVTKVQLGQLACKLFDSVAGACKIGEVELLVHVSIGIAHWPDDGVEPEILLKNADRAMYQAKRVKSGYAFCDSLPHSPELVQAKVAIAPV